MKQRKKITRVLNMVNLKQKRQKVNLQMSRRKTCSRGGIYHEHNADKNLSTVEKTTLP
jgi:hypothetical protein